MSDRAETLTSRALDAGATSARSRHAAPLLRDSGEPERDVVHLLQLIVVELRAQRGQTRGTGLSKRDRDVLAALLPEISAAIGDYVFSARELVAHATTEDRVLRDSLERATGPFDTGTVRRIGKLLHRAEGFVCGEARVIRAGDAREGALWKIVASTRV